MEVVGLILVEPKLIFNFYIIYLVTPTKLIGLLWGVAPWPILVFHCLDDSVESAGLDIFVFAFKMLMNFFIDFSEAFPEFGVEMVLDAVVSPRVSGGVPSGEVGGDKGPFIADLVLHIEQFIFLLEGPFFIADVFIEVVMISGVDRGVTSSGIAYHFFLQARIPSPSPTKSETTCSFYAPRSRTSAPCPPPQSNSYAPSSLLQIIYNYYNSHNKTQLPPS